MSEIGFFLLLNQVGHLGPQWTGTFVARPEKTLQHDDVHR